MKIETLEEPLSGSQSRTVASSVYKNLVFLTLLDLAIGVVAYLTAWIIRMSVPLPYTLDLLPGERWDMVSHPWLLLVISQTFFLYIFGLYDDLRATRYREIIWFLLMACLLQMIAITSFFYLTNYIFPRSVIVLFDLANVVLLSGWRSHVKSQLKKHVLRVLIVGEKLESAREIIREIERNPSMGRKIAGLVLGRESANQDPDREPAQRPWELNYPILGSLDQIHTIIVRYGIEEIVFTSEQSWKDRVLNSISKLQAERPVQIAILPSVYEIVIGKLRHINIHDTPLIQVNRNPNEPFQRFIKRSFDLGLSALGLLLLSPVFLMVGILVKVFSPGRISYQQERVGYGQKTFRLIKFRTMIADAERFSGETYAQIDDPRVTPIGKILRRFRVDELPQLVNVLKGDMSFVGPRPERPVFAKTFGRQVPGYNERHKIKPGLTGLAQVRSYYHTAVENKLKYDLAYIYNYSFSLDLLILLETIKVVLIRKGS